MLEKSGLAEKAAVLFVKPLIQFVQNWQNKLLRLLVLVVKKPPWETSYRSILWPRGLRVSNRLLFCRFHCGETEKEAVRRPGQCAPTRHCVYGQYGHVTQWASAPVAVSATQSSTYTHTHTRTRVWGWGAATLSVSLKWYPERRRCIITSTKSKQIGPYWCTVYVFRHVWCLCICLALCVCVCAREREGHGVNDHLVWSCAFLFCHVTPFI